MRFSHVFWRFNMDYIGPLSLLAGVPANLLTLLVAAGFIRSALADDVEIIAGAAAISVGSTSALASTGRPIAINASWSKFACNRQIDLKSIWLYCASNTTITVYVRGI